MTRICEHECACLHLRRYGGHSLDGLTIVKEPCQLALCRACDDWLNETLKRLRTTFDEHFNPRIIS